MHLCTTFILLLILLPICETARILAKMPVKQRFRWVCKVFTVVFLTPHVTFIINEQDTPHSGETQYT